METTNDFAQSVLQPKVLDLYRHEDYDRDIYYEYGKQGMIGAALPWKNEDPISNVAWGLMNKEVERVDSGFRSMLSV